MSNGSHRSYRRQKSIYQVHYCLKKQEEEVAIPWPWAMEIQAYSSQVAGHQKTEGTKYLGLLQSNNGTILKPILKEAQKREVDFYERVNKSDNVHLAELKSFIPKYSGCKKFAYNNFENDYIILEDLAQKMIEPCIMDVKIGKRTWDPLASEEKIKNEMSKYALCKQEYGFCIPGFQVYKITSGRLHKYGKDYGKKLHGQSVKDAIKNYLNGTGTGVLCRALIVQFLSELWKIHKWASKQTAVKLYATSLLLVYDANKLRACCGESNVWSLQSKCARPEPGARRRSIHTMHSYETNGSNFSGQLTANGPIYKKLHSVPITSMSLAQSTFSSSKSNSVNSPWTAALDKMQTNHSFEHNYEDNMSKIKMNYRAMLDQMSNDRNPNPWGTVKIIDFAHAFFNEADDHAVVDDNFRDGVKNFVKIFEDLLSET